MSQFSISLFTAVAALRNNGGATSIAVHRKDLKRPAFKIAWRTQAENEEEHSSAIPKKFTHRQSVWWTTAVALTAKCYRG